MKFWKIIRDLIPYVFIVFLVIIIRTYIATPVRVDGNSMRKTLEDGDILLLYKMAKFERNDIIVLDEKEDNEIIIKRIIALPGETIKIQNGKIYINDKEYNDEFAYGDTSDYEQVTLDEDEYFILGDNRLISKDSRYFGTITEDEIIGKVVFRFWPFSKIGTVN